MGTVPRGWDPCTPQPCRAQAEAAQEPRGWGVTAPRVWEGGGEGERGPPQGKGLGCCSSAERGQRGTAGCNGRGDSDTRADGARQGRNSPLMQFWEPRGAGPPGGVGTEAEAVSTRDFPCPPPALGSKTNATGVRRKEQAGGQCITRLLGILTGPRCSPGRAGSNRLPGPTAVPQLPEISSSQLGPERRRNPQAALPGARPGHLHGHREDETREFHTSIEEASTPRTGDTVG